MSSFAKNANAPLKLRPQIGDPEARVKHEGAPIDPSTVTGPSDFGPPSSGEAGQLNSYPAWAGPLTE